MPVVVAEATLNPLPVQAACGRSRHDKRDVSDVDDVDSLLQRLVERVVGPQVSACACVFVCACLLARVSVSS